MISVDVLAGSPNADANSEDFIFFDFLSFLDSLSLPIVQSPSLCKEEDFVVRLDLKFSRSAGGRGGRYLREDYSRLLFRG